MVLKPYLELCRITLSLFSALSAVTGYILAGSGLALKTAFVATGIFLSACGASALNQYQERRTDAFMERTKGRPLPSGRIRPFHALYFSLLLLCAGMTALVLSGSLAAVLLGACAVILYNGLYTYLKRKTAFASVPCAVIGALPPAMGWFAAGGSFPDQRLTAVCFLFFIWQISHFWLLFLTHGRDYERAGLPSLTRVFERRQLERITFVWFLSTTVGALLTPFYGLTASDAANYLLCATAILHMLNGMKLLRGPGDIFVYRIAFSRMNAYILFVMLLLSADRVINR
ncbi:MAG: protoheme IX farnesyltransferase [Nitrospirae bacterium]|nr:protoheme IX farnesyltransferase [Nitrospirota bacterium]